VEIITIEREMNGTLEGVLMAGRVVEPEWLAGIATEP
jgi:hypothetical protein